MTRANESDLLFFDGDCGFCHASVKFAVRRDRARRFRFAPIGGPTFLAHPAGLSARSLPDSIVIATTTGEVLTLGSAALYLLAHLPAPWPLVSRMLALLPRSVVDFGYRSVARVRRRLFPPPQGVCPILPKELAQRFDA